MMTVTIYPVDTQFPSARSLHFAANHARASNVIIQLGVGGDFLIRASLPAGSVQFIVDVNGYYQ